MSSSRTSFRVVSLLSLCTLLQLFLQLGFHLLLARAFGAAAEMDAFTAAMALPGVVSVVVAGSLQYAFIPQFIQRREGEGSTAAWRLASTLGLLLMLTVGLLALLGMAAALPLVRLLQPGFSETQTLLTADLFQILVWQMWGVSTSAFLQSLHHCEQRFATPALASLAGAALTLLWTAATYRMWGIHAVASGVLAGSLLSCTIQIPILLGNFRRPSLLDDSLDRVLRSLLPLVLGAAYYKLDPVVDRFLASRLPEGSVAYLGYADRLIGALLVLTTSGLAIVAFPVLSRYAAAGRSDELKHEIVRVLRFLIYILVPTGTALLLFHNVIVRDLFQRGEFSPADTRAVGLLLALYVGLLIGASAGDILMKVFFSLGDTRTPVLIGLTGFTLGVLLKFWLVPTWGIGAIAAGTSIYYLLNATVATVLLRFRLGEFPVGQLAGSLLRCLAAAAAAAIVGMWITAYDFRGVSLVGAAAGGAIYLAVTWLLGEDQARLIWQRRLNATPSNPPPESPAPPPPE